MANSTEFEECMVISAVRPGLKREMAFALKAQSEICGGALGRAWSRKALSDSLSSPASSSSQNKRLKMSSDASREDKDDAEKLDSGAGKAAQAGNVATGDLKDGEREKSVRVVEGAGNLMNEEEANSDVVDLEDELERTFEYSSSDKVVIDVDGIKTGTSCQERQHKAVTTVPGGNNKAIEKESDMGKSLVDECNKEGFSLDKPSRRFTRSSLKPKVEEEEKFATIRRANSTASKPAHNCDEDKHGNLVSTSGMIPAKLEMKMSKKIGLRHPFVTQEDFLETGLLEGFHVKYCQGSRQERTGFGGVIRGNGIMCSCNQCKGVQVVSPTIFELHAGSSIKLPSEYIFLEHGRSILDVVNAVNDSPLETLREAVQAVLGASSINRCTVCLNCQALLEEVEGGRTDLLCKVCWELKEACTSPCPVPDATDLLKEVPDTTYQMKELDTTDLTAKVSDTSDQLRKVQDAIEGSPEPCLVEKSSVRATCTTKCSLSQIKSCGRLTRKDLGLHKLVLKKTCCLMEQKLPILFRGRKCWLAIRKGMESSACAVNLSYMNIYTSNGVSLHELSVSLAKTRRLLTTENDDLCSICFDGGDLLCCDTCPRAFDLDCIHLSSLPIDGWSCRYCENMFQKERFVEHNANALAAGRVAGADVIQQITNWCIRIVKTPEIGVGGCTLCRGHGFAKSGFGPCTCEKEFHVGCLKDHKMANLKQLPEGKWFCCTDCEWIHSALVSYVVRGEEKLLDSLVGVIRSKLVEKGLMNIHNLDVGWRVLNGKMVSSDESRHLLTKSVSIFHEQFDPITESAAGQDLIPAMVYGKSYKGQEFSGMFCIILNVNQGVVSAGLLRIFGEEVAELPLVATSSDCQGQGYFQSLFVCMERLLASFHVKKLVLPAAEEAESIWTKKFGFNKIALEVLREFRRKHHMMIFEGTSVLQKALSGAAVEGGWEGEGAD